MAMNNKNILIGVTTAVAGAAVIKSIRGNSNKRKVKKAVNRAFNTVSDTVQSMR